jgi:hypothetical protein
VDKAQVISDVLSVYRHGKVNQTVEDKITRMLVKLDDELFVKVTDWILEEHTGYRLDVRHVKEAIDECKPRSEPFPLFEVECLVCGTAFKTRGFGSSEEENLAGEFHFCPRCGITVRELQSAKYYLKTYRVLPENWERRVEELLQEAQKRGGKPYFDREFCEYSVREKKRMEEERKSGALPPDAAEQLRAYQEQFAEGRF